MRSYNLKDPGNKNHTKKDNTQMKDKPQDFQNLDSNLILSKEEHLIKNNLSIKISQDLTSLPLNSQGPLKPIETNTKVQIINKWCRIIWNNFSLSSFIRTTKREGEDEGEVEEEAEEENFLLQELIISIRDLFLVNWIKMRIRRDWRNFSLKPFNKSLHKWRASLKKTGNKVRTLFQERAKINIHIHKKEINNHNPGNNQAAIRKIRSNNKMMIKVQLNRKTIHRRKDQKSNKVKKLASKAESR